MYTFGNIWNIDEYGTLLCTCGICSALVAECMRVLFMLSKNMEHSCKNTFVCTFVSVSAPEADNIFSFYVLLRDDMEYSIKKHLCGHFDLFLHLRQSICDLVCTICLCVHLYLCFCACGEVYVIFHISLREIW